MQRYESLDIIRKLREQRANDPGANGTPGGLEPISIPLDWTELTNKEQTRALARLCQPSRRLEVLCSVCMKQGTSQCSSCGVRYCSEACHNDDWKRHKVICKLFAKWDTSKRPSAKHFAAILFPTYREKPELVWCRLVNRASKLEVAHSDFKLLKSHPIKGITCHVNYSITGRMFLGHGLALVDVYKLGSLEEEHLANINKSIMSLADPGSLTSYAGPHIVFAFRAKRNGRPARMIDVVPGDWRHATDYIILNLMNTFISEEVPESEWFQRGTKLNNMASTIITKLYSIEKPIETVAAPRTYWPIEGPCVPAVQLGLPWKTRYVQDSEMVMFSEESWTFTEEMKYVKKYFFRPAPEHHGEPARWAGVSKFRCGSMIILPLAKHRIVHQHHVLALNKYLDYSLKRREVPSKEGFMAYWEKYIAVTSLRESFEDVPNPYHRLPQRDEVVIHLGGDNDDFINAMMNLLGHFAEKGYVMAVEENGDVFVPKDLTAPYDTEGTFEFTAEERSIPGSASMERALESIRESGPSSSTEDIPDGPSVEMAPEDAEDSAHSSSAEDIPDGPCTEMSPGGTEDPAPSSSAKDIPGGPAVETTQEGTEEPTPSSNDDRVDGIVDGMGHLLN